MRADVSGPPAPNPTMIRTGRLGQLCAWHMLHDMSATSNSMPLSANFIHPNVAISEAPVSSL